MSISKYGPKRKTHGTGNFLPRDISKLGHNVVFEDGALVFHPENIEIGDNVYVGHYSILKGYFKNKMIIGGGTWIGQHCLLHSPAGLTIGENVGIGPGVKIITSVHRLDEPDKPILHSTIDFLPVVIGYGCDIGAGAVILPGVNLGKGVQVGAGAVVTKSFGDYSVIAGIPAKLIRKRK